MNDDALADLADSIADVGLLNPLTVRVLGDGLFQIIAGSHRYAACELAAIHDIPCQVVTLNDLQAELAMIDENLRRSELEGVLRDRQLARRKVLYLELHPATAHGGDRKSDQVANLATRSDARFSAETAELTGKSERTVQRAIERGEKITEAAAEILHGTPLDTGIYRDKLKGVPAAEQADRVQRDLAQPPPPRPLPKPRPAAGEMFSRFLALAADLEGLEPKDIVAGIPAERDRANLKGHVRSLLAMLEDLDAMTEGDDHA